MKGERRGEEAGGENLHPIIMPMLVRRGAGGNVLKF
jgi:hypothetical protein